MRSVVSSQARASRLASGLKASPLMVMFEPRITWLRLRPLRVTPHISTAESALQAGDLGAAVDACEKALGESGGLTGTVARDQLPLVEQIYGAILGGPDRVPSHGRAMGDLEPRSAFLLSRIDGSMTVEDVLDVSGMPRLEALRVMALLVRRGAVVIK